MSYTQKQQGSGGSGGQSQQQAAKSLAGINQQMQNLVHGQNNLPQAAAQAAFANLNMTLQQQQQQQRFESLFKQQQLLFGANHPQFQQHFQQQMQQTATKEPLALTRSPADLLNKKQQHHQQQANGSTSVPSLAGNLTNQQLQQQLQAFSQAPANLMQQLQAYHQMQQQQNQKMLSSLNQAQSLSIQQQHMQQLQQTLQQQKMMASHSKSMSSGAQMKLAVVSNPPATQTVQSNNNLPNKAGNKAGSVAASSQQGKQQQQATSQGSPKNAPNQTFGKNTVVPGGGDKTAASPQLATCKPGPVSTQKINTATGSLTKPSSKPSTPPNKSPIVAPTPSPVKAGISPSSSPKPVVTSAPVAKTSSSAAAAAAAAATIVPIPAAINATPTTPAVNDTAIKNPPPGLTITPSQGPSVTAPSAIPPKPFTQPVAAIPVRASTVEPEPEPEPKKAEEPKPEEEKVTPPQEGAKEEKTEVVEKEKDKPKPEEPAPVEESKEDVKEVEKTSEVATEENDNPEKEIPEKEKSQTEVDSAAAQDNTNSSSAEASSEESLAKPEVSAEVPTSSTTTKATATAAVAKPKSNQRRNIQTSEEAVQKEQPPQPSPPQKPERKRPVREVSKPEKVQKVISPGTPKNSDDRRSKRHRLKTILYQSPLPELAFIAKLSASEASCSPKTTDEKLIIFYKNEYLAVRNAEGGFFLCQTLQNVYKTSPRIRIRWLSEEKKESNVYIPDFYDNTDIECVLTTVEMEKVNKTSIRLPKAERSRIENILKKAIDVEKGVLPRPNVTEENPDGLDISLYKNESQIEKKTPLRKRKLSLSHSSKKSHSKPKSPKKKKRTRPIKEHGSSESSEEDSEDEETDNDQEYKPSRKRDLDTQPKLRAQRSPLARARAASPITIREHSTRTRTSIVPDKSIAGENSKEEVEVTSTAVSRSDRAKRRATESGGIVEDEVPTKKPVSKKIETKSPGKGKTGKSDDEPIIVLEASKSMPETPEVVAKSSKAESSESIAKSAKVVSSMSAKKSKPSSSSSSSVDATMVATQSASGGRTTRSRK